MYQVGNLQMINENAPKFEGFGVAIDYALEQSIDDSIYGVWDLESGDLKTGKILILAH